MYKLDYETDMPPQGGGAPPELQFEYQPLDPARKEIRVLKFQPNDEFSGQAETIRITLERLSLLENPLYLTLSYVWGDDARVEPVVCNDQKVMITSNLHKALLCVSDSLPRGSNPLYDEHRNCPIWVDGLCINQDDIEEKQFQVALMKQIYTQSRGTIAYIGSPVRTTSKDGVKAMFRALGALPISFDRTGRITEVTFNMKAAHEFFGRPFFNRSWIVQEMAISREVICLYGSKGDWQTFGLPVWLAMAENAPAQRASLIHNRLMGDDWGGEDPHKLSQQLWNLSEFTNLKKQLLKYPSGLNPVKAVSMTRLYDARDPRDKVYSLLGLFSDEDAAAVKIDYSAPPARVYTEFATLCVSLGYALDLLEHSRIVSRVGDLPSWVPDWTWIPSTTLHGQYHCADSVPGQISLLDDNRLSVRGIQLDVVKIVGPKCEYDLRKGESIQFIDMPKVDSSKAFTLIAVVYAQELCKTIADQDGRIHGQPLDDIVWQSLLVGYSCHHRRRCLPEDRRYYDAFNKVYGRGYRICNDIIKMLCQGDDIEALIDMADTFAGIVHHLDGRALCTTEAGCLCVLPNEATPGDIIVAILGAQTPYLIRKIEGPGDQQYKVLGPCYMHGVMEGEIWDANSNVLNVFKVGPETDFILV